MKHIAIFKTGLLEMLKNVYFACCMTLAGSLLHVSAIVSSQADGIEVRTIARTGHPDSNTQPGGYTNYDKYFGETYQSEFSCIAAKFENGRLTVNNSDFKLDGGKRGKVTETATTSLYATQLSLQLVRQPSIWNAYNLFNTIPRVMTHQQGFEKRRVIDHTARVYGVQQHGTQRSDVGTTLCTSFYKEHPEALPYGLRSPEKPHTQEQTLYNAMREKLTEQEETLRDRGVAIPDFAIKQGISVNKENGVTHVITADTGAFKIYSFGVPEKPIQQDVVPVTAQAVPLKKTSLTRRNVIIGAGCVVTWLAASAKVYSWCKARPTTQ